MTNLVNPAGNYTAINAGIDKNDVQNTLNNSTQAGTNKIEDNSTLNSMMISPDVMMKTAALVPPLVMADRFINSKIGGEENNSLFKKIANFGDKITRTLHLEWVTGEKIDNFIKNNRFTKFFTDDYKANQRCSLAKIPSMKEKYTKELAEQLSKLKDNPEFSKLFEDGTGSLSKDAKQYLQNINPKNALKETDNLIKVTEELISKGVDTVKPGNILSSKVTLSELRNQVKTANLQMGETKLGSFIAKNALEAKHSFTFGGGILGLAFVSFAFNEAYKSASEAPEGEKISTFMHVLSEQFIGFMLFKPSINLMYKLGGNKYRGMSVEAREALENLIQKTNADENISKEAVKVAKLQRDLLIKGVNKDEVAKLAGKSLEEAQNIAKGLKSEGNLKFWEKPLKAVGKVLSAGLDEIQPTKFEIFGKKFKPTLAGSLGGFARFALILFAIQPFLQKPITNLCHKIFGKPNAYLEKDKTDTPSENKAEQNLQETNLVKKWTSLPDNIPNNSNTEFVQSQPNMPSQNNNTNNLIAASNIKENQVNESELYVPSIQVDNSYLQNQDNELNQRVDAILKSSEKQMNYINQSIYN